MRKILPALLLLFTLTGCYSFPTASQVEHADATVDTDLNQGIAVTARPPAEDATPQAIIDGFFAAQESFTDGYGVARQYLSPDASIAWKPESGITVYDVAGSSLVFSAENRVALQATVIGHVDSDGVFTSVHEQNFTHDFELIRVNGQWRIRNAPDGLLMSSQRFHRAYSAQQIYFFNTEGNRIVPQQVYLRSSEVVASSADVLVRALIAGPSAVLRSSVIDALPAEITSNGTRIDDHGIAHVNLNAAAEALPAEQRELAAIQLLATLGQLPEVTGLSVTANGKSLSIPLSDDQNVIPKNVLNKYRGAREPASRRLFAIADDRVVQISPNSTQYAPITGALGQGWEKKPEKIAVDWYGFNIAIIADGGTTIHTTTTDSGTPNQIYSGTSLLQPQYAIDNSLWTIDNTPDGPLLVVGKAGKIQTNKLSELGNSKVLAFRISPDMSRIALVLDVGGHQVLGMMGLRTATASAEGWREIPVNSRNGLLTQIRDVAFVSPAKLFVVGASERDPQFTVNALDLDGGQVDFQGPLTEVNVAQLATLPAANGTQIAILTTDGDVLRYEAQYRWPTMGTGVSSIAFPS